MKVTKRQLKRIIREEKNSLIAETRIRRAVRSMLTEKKVNKKYYQHRANPKLAKQVMSQPGGQLAFHQGVRAYVAGVPVNTPMKPGWDVPGGGPGVGISYKNPELITDPEDVAAWTAGWNDAAQLDAAGIDPENPGKSAKKQKKKKPARQRYPTDGYTDDQLDTAEMEGGEDFEMGRSKSEVPREYRGTALEDAWLDGWKTMKRSR